MQIIRNVAIAKHLNEELESFTQILSASSSTNQHTLQISTSIKVDKRVLSLSFNNSKKGVKLKELTRRFLTRNYWHEIFNAYGFILDKESIAEALDTLDEQGHKTPKVIFKMESDEIFDSFIQARHQKLLDQARDNIEPSLPQTDQPVDGKNIVKKLPVIIFSKFQLRISAGTSFSYDYEIDTINKKLKVIKNESLGIIENPILLDLTDSDMINFNKYLPSTHQMKEGYNLYSELSRIGTRNGIYIKPILSSDIVIGKTTINLITSIKLDVGLNDEIYSHTICLKNDLSPNIFIQNSNLLNTLMYGGASIKTLKVNLKNIVNPGLDILDVNLKKINFKIDVGLQQGFKRIIVIGKDKLDELQVYVFSEKYGATAFSMEGDILDFNGEQILKSSNLFSGITCENASQRLTKRFKHVSQIYFSTQDSSDPANIFT